MHLVKFDTSTGHAAVSHTFAPLESVCKAILAKYSALSDATLAAENTLQALRTQPRSTLLPLLEQHLPALRHRALQADPDFLAAIEAWNLNTLAAVEASVQEGESFYTSDDQVALLIMWSSNYEQLFKPSHDLGFATTEAVAQGLFAFYELWNEYLNQASTMPPAIFDWCQTFLNLATGAGTGYSDNLAATRTLPEVATAYTALRFHNWDNYVEGQNVSLDAQLSHHAVVLLNSPFFEAGTFVRYYSATSQDLDRLF